MDQTSNVSTEGTDDEDNIDNSDPQPSPASPQVNINNDHNTGANASPESQETNQEEIMSIRDDLNSNNLDQHCQHKWCKDYISSLEIECQSLREDNIRLKDKLKKVSFDEISLRGNEDKV